MDMVIVLLVSILPTIVIISLIYKSDKKEKEPVWELIKAFLLGFLAIVITLAVSFAFGITNFNMLSADLISIFFYAMIEIALVEELSKWILGFLFLKNNKHFDYTFDGIVYFVFISLGFATVENVLYVMNGGLLIALIRAVATVPGHAFFAIFSGYYYSLYRRQKEMNNKELSNKYLLYSIIFPIVLHGIFDFLLLSQMIIFIITFIFFLIFLYIKAIGLVKQAMREEKSIKNINQIVYGNNIEPTTANFYNKKVCPYCRKEVDGNFCIYCGGKLEE